MNKELFLEFKRSLLLAFPLMVALVAEMGMRVTDSVMMGYLGPSALAAGALSVGAYFLVLVLIFGIISAVGICMAGVIGADEHDRISHYFQQGAYLSLLLCLPIMWLLWDMAALFPLLKQNSEVSYLAGEYLRGTMWGMPALFGFLLLRELAAGLEKPMMVMYVALVALPINALLDYLFIFGRWGFPQWGMFGIGFASSLTQWVLVTAIFVYCTQVSIIRPHLLKKFLLPRWQEIRHILKIGFPAGLVYLFEIGLFTVSAFMMGKIGVTPLAAHQVVIQCLDVAFIFILGIAQATAIRVAYSMGSEDLVAIKNVAKVSVTVSLVISLSFAAIFLYFPEKLTDIFINIDGNLHPELTAYAEEFFKVAVFFVLFDGLQVLGNNALRGLKDTIVPMFLGAASYWIIGIVVAYLLGFKYGFAGLGIWYGMGLGIAVSAIILWIRWFYMLKKLQKKTTILPNHL